LLRGLQGAKLDDSLTKSGNPLDEAVLFSIPLDVLSSHKAHQSLANR
jgi:hypothetical protein